MRGLIRGCLVIGAVVGLASSCSTTETVDTAWNLVGPPTGDVLEIVVAVGSSSCNSFDELHVTETEEAVDIRTTIEVDDPGNCTDDLTTSTQTIELDARLGDRALTGCRPADGRFTDLYERDVPTGGDCRRALDRGF
jgi:hypothetical protein